MNELIQVAERQVGSDTVPTVNARDLWRFVESKQDFSTWIKYRLGKYGFVENEDYLLHNFVEQVPHQGGMRQSAVIHYYLTLETAKELAMVENNDKGRQIRRYFIECERRAKSNVIDIATALDDPAKLRTALLAYTEKVMSLEAKVQEQAPKARFHDAVTEAINCQSVQEVAKVLCTGPNRLFKFLRDEEMLMHNNLPFQKHIDAGYFRVVERQYNDGRGESHTYTRTLITGKGLAYIQKRFQSRSNFLQEEATA